MNSLIFFLKNEEKYKWYLVDAQGVFLTEGDENNHDYKNEHYSKTIVFVPTQAILLTSVRLPKLKNAKLLAAIPYALEEQLISDVNELHFATIKSTDETTVVAVVEKQILKNWLTRLEQINIIPDELCPSVACIPFAPNTWTLVVGDVVEGKLSSMRGFATEKEFINEFLSASLISEDNKPELIKIYNCTQESLIPKLSLHDFEVKVEESFLQDNEVWDFNVPRINLLQGSFVSKKKSAPKNLKIKQSMIALGALVTAIFIVSQSISYTILKNYSHVLNAKINQIYAKNFPEAKRIVAPKLRMEEKLTKLANVQTTPRLLLLLNYLGQAIKVGQGIQLKKIEYHNSKLLVDASAVTSKDFSKFIEFMQKQPVKIKQQTTNLNAKGLNAVIILE